jgi:hypothetical protein
MAPTAIHATRAAASRARAPPALLRAPHDAVDQVAGEPGRDEARERHDGGGREAEGELSPVARDVAEQPQDDRRLAAGDERLRVAHRSRDGVGVDVVGVAGRHRTPRHRLLEHEADVLDRAALPLGVAHDEQRRVVGRAEEDEAVGAEPGRLLHRLDARAFHRRHLPLARRGAGARERDVARAECEPRLAEAHGRGGGRRRRAREVGEGVELHRVAAPRALDAGAELGGEPRRLADVPADDLLVLLDGIHGRDPAASLGSKKAFQGWGSTRKAGSRHRILDF